MRQDTNLDDDRTGDRGTKTGRGQFFHIDRRTWTILCELADVKLAVTYLAIAQGTLKGGRISSWSAKSIETHLGLHSTRAKTTIGELIDFGFLQRDATAHSTPRRPRYVVPPFHEVFEAMRPRRIAALSPYDKWVMERIVETGDSGWTSTARSKKSEEPKALARLNQASMVRQEQGKWYVAKPSITPELIWLPNTIVQGTDRGEGPPAGTPSRKRHMGSPSFHRPLPSTESEC